MVVVLLLLQLQGRMRQQLPQLNQGFACVFLGRELSRRTALCLQLVPTVVVHSKSVFSCLLLCWCVCKARGTGDNNTCQLALNAVLL